MLTLEAENKKLKEQLDYTLTLLANWCVSIDINGAGWDYWDDYYKEAMYGESPIRKLFDEYLIIAKEYYE